MSVIGIDLGNSECVIAQAKRGGIDIILNENSNRKNPTLVSFQGKQRFAGEQAVNLLRSNFKNTITDIKRLIGRKFREAEVQEEISRLAYNCVELPNGLVGVEILYNDEKTVFSCEMIVAMMLSKLKSIADIANPGAPVGYAVLGVPGWWNDAQRRLMIDAAKIADINVLQLMNEHTAVALAYGIYKSARNLFHESEPQYVMFIDLGHSSYTVSVVAFVQGKLQVKSACFDRALGGRDFDYALYKTLAQKFKEKTRLEVVGDKKATVKLLAAAERAKKSLSPLGVSMTHVSVECLKEERDFEYKLELTEYETVIQPLINRLEAPILEALAEAGIDKKQLACVEIVGGGTRVPAVKAKLASVLGLDANATNFGLSTTLNADESVARGCGLECAILSPLFKVKEFNIVERQHYPVRIFWEQQNTIAPMETEDGEEDGLDGVNEVTIFQHGDDFPKVRRVTFRRNQAFEVCAAYDDEAKIPTGSAKDIGKFKISGIEAFAKDGEACRVRINVKEDIHGVFSVSSAHLMQPIEDEPTPPVPPKEGEEKKEEKMETEKDEAPKKKKFKKIELQVDGTTASLTRQQLMECMELESRMAQQDRIIRETADMRNSLETYIYNMRDQLLDRLRDFCKDNDRMAFSDKLTAMEDWLYSDAGFNGNKQTFKEKLDELQKLGNPIEHRYKDSTERTYAGSELISLLDEYDAVVRAGSTNPKYDHLAVEDWSKIRTEVTNARNWYYDELSKQGSRQLFEDPVLTCLMIRDRRSKVDSTCKVVLSKPKPKPQEPEKPAAPEPAPQEKPAAGDAKNASSSADATDADFFMPDADSTPKPPPKTDDELAEDVNGETMELD